MLARLFLLFTIVPVVELYLLISIGKLLGAGATVGLVLVTGLLGAALARREGSRVLRSWQEATQRGEIPKDGVISSVLVLVGGVLLVTPGVMTDVTGLLLLIPLVRRRVAVPIKRWLERRFQIQAVGDPRMFGFGGSPFGPPEPDDVIDATAVEADEADRHRAEAPAPPSRAAP